MQDIPENLARLHLGEEELRTKALAMIKADNRLALHLRVVERGMDLADLIRQFPTDNEDLKVIQVLGMRLFNAFGASLKLALSGYGQNSALIMRDVLETLFLLELFRGDMAAIARWRSADKKARIKEFSPLRVREALDARDGFATKKRAAVYELFSELAAHPTMKSVLMMRPQKNGDAVIGPFLEKTAIEAVLSEMGRLAIQAGGVLDGFLPNDWVHAAPAREDFAASRLLWVATFYPDANRSGSR
jgi:hypothetical protein